MRHDPLVGEAAELVADHLDVSSSPVAPKLAPPPEAPHQLDQPRPRRVDVAAARSAPPPRVAPERRHRRLADRRRRRPARSRPATSGCRRRAAPDTRRSRSAGSAAPSRPAPPPPPAAPPSRRAAAAPRHWSPSRPGRAPRTDPPRALCSRFARAPHPRRHRVATRRHQPPGRLRRCDAIRQEVGRERAGRGLGAGGVGHRELLGGAIVCGAESVAAGAQRVWAIRGQVKLARNIDAAAPRNRTLS